MTTTAVHRCDRCTGSPVFPRRLAPGNAVAVCTPSGPGAPVAAGRFARGLRWLREAGYDVRVGAQAHATGYAAGPAKARAEEFNQAMRDPSVRAIVTTIGGYNSNGLLAHLDYAALARDPKVIVGYSDVTALLLAAYARCGVVTFHGPTLMPELAEFPRPLPYTWAAVGDAVSRAAPLGRLVAPTSLTEEFLRWDADDDRPRELRPHPGWQWLAAGVGNGRLVGGNLDTIGVLVGTPYLPCVRGAVLFWETCADSLAVVDRALCHLDTAGVTGELAGMVVGRSFRAGQDFEQRLRALVTERYGGCGYPILAGVDLGHTDPMLTLPIGVRARLDAERDEFAVVDGAVR